MQDQDVPPVEEGETGDGADAVQKVAAIRKAGPVAITNATAFTPHLWITATARHWPAATMVLAPAGIGLALRLTTRRLNPSRCPCARMPRHAFSALWTIYFSRPRFRRPRAS